MNKKPNGTKRTVIPCLMLVILLSGCALKSPEIKQPAPAAAQPAPAAGPLLARERRQPERDPFLAPAVVTAEQKKLAEIKEEGRDPFQPVPNVVIPPEVKPEEPPAAQPGPVEPGTGPVNIQLVALDRCWIDVFVDNERVLRTNLPKDGSVSFAGGEVRLEQVGREWALDVTLNGRYLGVLKDLVPDLQKGPVTYNFDGTRVRVSLGQRYSGGVLVGLNFKVIK